MHLRLPARMLQKTFLCTVGIGVVAGLAAVSTVNAAHTNASQPAKAAQPAKATASCSSVKTGGSMNMGVSTDALGFDPSMTQDVESLSIDLNVFDQLVRVHGNGLAPDLASSWQVKNGGKTILFHLRHNAKFYDGTPVTASDVKFSFDHVERKGAVNTWTLPGMKSTTVIDRYTFQVTLKKPSAAFMQALTLWGASILSEKAFKKEGAAKFATHPVGSGPFYVSKWVRGQYVQLKRNPYYWQKDACGHAYPYLDSIKLVLVPDDNTRTVELQGGTLDAILNVPLNSVDTLSKTKGVKGITSPAGNFSYYSLNQSFAPFRDRKIVQAMNYALDRNAIVKAVLHGHGVPLMSPVAPHTLFHTDKYGYAYNLAKAKQLMAASKYPKGFKVKLLTIAGDSIGSALAVVMQSEFKEIGIDMSIQPLDATTQFSTWSKGDYQMAYAAGTPQTLDPDSNMQFCCVSWGGANSNFTGWKDTQVDNVFAKTQTALDPKKRAAYYDQFQKLVMERAPLIWLVGAENSYGLRDNVHGFNIDVNVHWPLWGVWKS